MKPPRILIVEDEMVVARDLQQQLLEMGYEPLPPTRRAEEAIALCGELRPELVLMDINLAGELDGIEAAKTIRDRFSVPVVFLTALAGAAVVDRAKVAEPFGYMVKPFDERELRTVVEMALYKHRAELLQREVREDLAAILRTAIDGFWQVDREGRILEVNDASCRMHGFTRGEMLAKGISDFEVDEAPAEIAETLQQTVRDGSGRFERRHRCQDGRIIHLEISINYRPGRHGCFFAFLRDVTHRKRAEAVLRSHLRLSEWAASCSLDELLQKTLDEAELLTESVIGFFYSVEADQKTLVLQSWSTRTQSKMCQAQGMGRHYNADLAGVWADCLRERRPVIHNDYAALAHRKGLPPGHAPVVRELVVPVMKDGLVMAIFGVGNKPRDYNEDDVATLVALASACWDIVARKQAEQARQKTEANLAALLNAATESLFLLDQGGTVLVANELAAQRLGVKAGALLGSCIYDHLPPEVAASRRIKFEETISTGIPARFIDMRNNRYCDHHVVPIRDEKGAVTRIAVFAADITESRETEAVLREQEQKMAQIFQTAPVGIGTVVEGVITEINDVFCAITGYARDEIVGRNSRFLYTSDEAFQEVGRAIQQCVVAPGHGSIETRWRRKQGEVIDVQLNASISHVRDNHLILVLSVMDVTARNVTARALRTSESRLRQAQKIFGLGVWEWDIANDRTNWSGEMFSIYGISPETFNGKGSDYIHFTHPDDRSIQVTQIQKAFERAVVGPTGKKRVSLLSLGTESGPRQFRIVRPDGTICWVEGEAEAIVNRAGQPVAMLGTLVDITKRREAEELLRTSEERFRLLFNSSNDAVVVYVLSEDGQPGCFIEVNEIACTRMGYTRDEMLKLKPFDVNSAASVAKLRANAAILTTEKRLLIEAEHITKDGRIFPVEISAHVFALNGRPTVLSVARDITDRKALEAQFRQAQKMEVIGQLAGGVAHDFNNILTAMLLNLELLRPTYATSEAGSLLHELESMTQRAAKLTQQLLMFARRQAIHVTPLELNGAVAGILKMLRRLLGEHVELRFVANNLALWIEADAGTLDQAVMNLCINARDAMPEGGVLTLATTRVDLDEESAKGIPEARPGSFACLSVRDTGCGMSGEILSHLFEPFFSTKEVGKGTGLGLASVHGIVHQHLGWINVESAVGKGTTFRIYLPASAGTSPRDLHRLPTGPNQGGTETILLVEDEEVVRKVTSIMLCRLGYRVLVAADGAEALRRWHEAEGAIDAVIADVVLPSGQTGLELAEKLRRMKPKLKVILMSGYSAEVIKGEALRLVDSAFLAKPFEFRTLSALLRQCLDREG